MMKLQANNLHLVIYLFQATSVTSPLPFPCSCHPVSRLPLDPILLTHTSHTTVAAICPTFTQVILLKVAQFDQVLPNITC